MIGAISIDILLSALTYMLPMLAGGAVGIYSYHAFKKRLHTVRQFLDVLDDALYDDRISEEEFRTLWSRFKRMI
ncbi:MAG: hypothetical protein QXL23_03965 [Candidatus Nitrosocaldus sp.]